MKRAGGRTERGEVKCVERKMRRRTKTRMMRWRCRKTQSYNRWMGERDRGSVEEEPGGEENRWIKK